MECNRFETEGLLMTAGELDRESESSYRSHLLECDFCRNELSFYEEGRKKFFSREYLEEIPSEKVDILIKKRCAVRSRFLFPAMFFPAVKKTALFVALLAIGMSAPVYFNVVNTAARHENEKKLAVNSYDSINVSSNGLDVSSENNDSLDTSSKKLYLKRGDLSKHEVVPVDVRP